MQHNQNQTTFNDLKSLLDAQETLNNKYVPNWRESILQEQKLSAVLTELAEWFESAPRSGGVMTNETPGWKWWKRNLEDDTQNKKIEIIDVLHFMLSSWMLMADKEEIVQISKTYQTQNLSTVPLLNIFKYFASYIVFTIEGDIKAAVYTGMGLLETLMEQSEMTWEDLENGYFLKNNLNHTRADGGYRDGEYSKYDENGHEDNRKLEV
jgi:dimeric dUTPase (all-alpha-NTP-PPase superfamily)